MAFHEQNDWSRTNMTFDPTVCMGALFMAQNVIGMRSIHEWCIAYLKTSLPSVCAFLPS